MDQHAAKREGRMPPGQSVQLDMEQYDAKSLPGLNLVMWEMASYERLSAETARREELQQEFLNEWKSIDNVA